MYKYFLHEFTRLGDLAQFLFTDVIQAFFHLCGCFAYFSKGELRVDENFRNHGLWRNTQGGKILGGKEEKGKSFVKSSEIKLRCSLVLT